LTKSFFLELGVSCGFNQSKGNYFCILSLDLTSAAKKQRMPQTGGEPVEKEPPVGTPKWALSNEWREIIESREQEQIEG